MLHRYRFVDDGLDGSWLLHLFAMFTPKFAVDFHVLMALKSTT